MRLMTLAKLTTLFNYHPHAVREAVLGGDLRLIRVAGRPFVLATDRDVVRSAPMEKAEPWVAPRIGRRPFVSALAGTKDTP